MSYKYFPIEFSSYEKYVDYLIEKGLAIKITEEKICMKLKVGDRIFYQKNGEFYVDRIADILSTKEGTLYELVDDNWWCVTEDELLDESDERVRDYMCMAKDAMIKLSDVRNWLSYNAQNYYISDTWSLFKDKDMIKDLCKAMLYK